MGDHRMSRPLYRGDRKILYPFDKGDRKINETKFAQFFRPPALVVNEPPLIMMPSFCIDINGNSFTLTERVLFPSHYRLDNQYI